MEFPLINKNTKKLDKIHIDLDPVFSYNLPFMFVISEREAGKSTKAWLKIWRDFYFKGKSTLVIRRHVIDVTETYIEDSLEILDKFCPNFDREKINYKRADLKIGILNVYYGDELFFRVVGLSKQLSSLKSLVMRNIGLMVFDEFICNLRGGEKYLKQESFKFKELYNTFQRECDGTLRVLFLGNPYSLYNPYFSDLKVDTSKIKAGAFVKGANYVIWCYQITDELKETILKRNPLYKFDDAYTRYAFNGEAINDANIKISSKPQNYRLEFAFRIDSHFLGVYRNMDYLDNNQYYIEEIQDISNRKKIYCFDFSDLLERTAYVTGEDSFRFRRLKRAFGNRQVLFNNLTCYYLMEDVYNGL